MTDGAQTRTDWQGCISQFLARGRGTVAMAHASAGTTIAQLTPWRTVSKAIPASPNLHQSPSHQHSSWQNPSLSTTHASEHQVSPPPEYSPLLCHSEPPYGHALLATSALAVATDPHQFLG
eukprot:GHUV01050638.1.p1 GENE.GHUV01050638.1~~GHUV01050638.1.p1  ORF type:complete len:121 (+),score=7.10 GHUV01050638.1:253-615(+)